NREFPTTNFGTSNRSFQTYPRSPIHSISFVLRFIKTSKHFSFSVISRIRLSPLHYQVTEEKLERSRLARAAAAVNHVPRLELGVSELAGMIIYLCYIL
ncbi:hypothetical protein LINGRAPRIM_LOCUS3222, partial [Linum grandiflorum]